MKTKYVSLTPIGAFALFTAGILLGGLVPASSAGQVPSFIFAILCFLLFSEDAKLGHQSGRYERDWLFWNWKGPSQ